MSATASELPGPLFVFRVKVLESIVKGWSTPST